MSMTNDELEAKIGVLAQRLALLPTRGQITALSALLTEFKTTKDQEITSLQQQVTSLQGEVKDLTDRVLALESA